jgi:hypothetical protein
MSLAAAALQIATVKAIEGKVSATIFDSKADPMKLRETPTPVVIVTAVAGRRVVEGREFFAATHTVDLVLDLGIARQVTRGVQDGENTVEVEFPDNDSGHDIVLHTLGYEILRALFASNDTWSDLWRQLVFRADPGEPSHWERGAVADNGVRLALTRHVLRLEVVADPLPGAELTELWTDLLAAMDADQELDDIAKVWRALITTPRTEDWMQAQAALGLTIEGIRSIGLAPLFETTNEPAPAATQAEVEDTDGDAVITVVPDGATLTEGDAAAVDLIETAEDE